jgi:hypothetical protein
MRSFLICLPLSLIAFKAFSQDTKEATPTEKVITVYLKDGTSLVGTFYQFTSDTLYFNNPVLGFQKVALTALNKFEFRNEGEKGAREVEPAETKNVSLTPGFGELNHNRYFLTPNGFGPKKGELFFRSFYVLSNKITYGLNDHISLSAGTNFVLLPMASVKYRGFLTSNTSVGVQGGIISFPISDGQDSAATLRGFFYGAAGASFGTIEKNISVGVGIADDVGSLIPFYFIGGSIKLFEQMTLTFEMPYLGANLSGGEDIFAPIFTPQFFLKRFMFGIGLTIIFEYFPNNQAWEFVQALPSANLSIRLGRLD